MLLYVRKVIGKLKIGFEPTSSIQQRIDVLPKKKLYYFNYYITNNP